LASAESLNPDWLFLVFVELLATPALVVGFVVRMVDGYVVNGLIKNAFIVVVETLFVILTVMLRNGHRKTPFLVTGNNTPFQ
jgi:hypothetical protein